MFCAIITRGKKDNMIIFIFLYQNHLKILFLIHKKFVTLQAEYYPKYVSVWLWPFYSNWVPSQKGKNQANYYGY